VLRVALALLILDGTARADRPAEHELKTSAPASVRPGERAQASLAVVPGKGLTIHAGAPLRVSLAVDPDGALVVPRRRLRRRDAADPRAEAPRFDLPFTAARAGTHHLVVEVRFWLCGRRTCWPVRDKATISVTVGEPPAASSAESKPAPSAGSPRATP
jgi:hypothetical protein